MLRRLISASPEDSEIIKDYYALRFSMYSWLVGCVYSLWNVSLIYLILPHYGDAGNEGQALELHAEKGVYFFIPAIILKIASGYFPHIKRNLYYYILLQIYLISAHFFIGVHISKISSLAAICTCVLLFCVVQLLVTVRSTILYCLFVVACGLLVSGDEAKNPKVLLFLGESTIALFAIISIIDKRKMLRAIFDFEKRATAILENVPTVMFTTNGDGYVTYVNPAWTIMTGQSKSNALGLGYQSVIHPEDLTRIRNTTEGKVEREEVFQEEVRILSKDGTYIWTWINCARQISKNGFCIKYVGTITDISSRKEAEEKLHSTEEDVKLAVEATGVGTWSIDFERNSIDGSPQFFTLIGLSPDLKSMPRTEFRKEFVHQADVNLTMSEVEGGRPNALLKFRIVKPSKEVIWVSTRVSRRANAEGKLESLIGTTIDITELRNADMEASQANDMVALALESGNFSTFEYSVESDLIKTTKLNVVTGENVYLSETLTQYTSRVHPEDLKATKENFVSAMKSHGSFSATFRVRRGEVNTDTYEWVHVRAKIYANKEAITTKVVGVSLNITETKHLVRELNDKNELFTITLKAANIAYWDWNPKTNEVVFDEEWFRQIDILDKDSTKLDSWMHALHPEDAPIVEDKIKKHLDGKSEVYEALMRLRSKQGHYKYVLAKGKILKRDEDGIAAKFAGVHVDLTAMMELKNKVEEQRRQLADAAKLASLGTLSAGVAHEMNNSLNFIDGAMANFKRLINDVCPADRKEQADQMLAVMGSGLAIAINVVKSLNSSISVSDRFSEIKLYSTIQNTVALTSSRLNIKLVSINVDENLSIFGSAAGLSQILMNLLINAGDAVDPKTGKINVSAKRVNEVAQPYVEILIQDNGSGMSDEVREKIFDPFFTTKEVGKGSGLGMFVVKNEVNKHGGSIFIQSEIGKGTTFSIRIPDARYAKVS